MKRILPIVALLGVTSFTHGQRLLTEDFNYTPGALTVAGGANVSGGNWVNTSGTVVFLNVSAGSLSYPGYGTGASSTNNNKVSLVATASSAEDAMRSFAAQTTGTTYVSFLMNVLDQTRLLDNTSAAGDFFTGFLTTGSTSQFNAGRVYIRKGVTANTINLGVSVSTTGNSPIVYSPIDYAVGTTHLVTLAFTSVAGSGNDTAKLFVNQPLSVTEPLVPDAISALMPTSTIDVADVAGLLLREGTNTPNVDIDGFKVSSDYYDATLPLSLTSFKASLVDKQVRINWASANEQNVSRFVVERSNDGRVFSLLGSVEASNARVASYTYTDHQPVDGKGFYRLQMIDIDGSVRYSQIISIINRKGMLAEVFPNPAVNNIKVSHAQAHRNASFSIIDISGKLIRTVKLEEGAVQTSMMIDDLRAGSYVLVFDNNGERTTTRFVK